MRGKVAVDLHVHSALSACAGEEMRPPEVLLTAEQRQVRILGLVDHCTARNAWAFVGAAQAFDVRVFAGLEVESAEGVHLLALFDSLEAATDMDRVIAEHLPGLPNNERLFGKQQLLDELGNVIGLDRRLLVTATDLRIDEIAEMVCGREGLAVPAHVDRQTNGLLPVLGFVPPGLQVQAFEVSRHLSADEARLRWPDLRGRPLLTASDAHCLDEIGQVVTWISEDLARAEVSAREWGLLLADEVLAAGS
ncbi:MAG: PHP domain-containing protein [Armatimonadota bacterium]